MGECSGGSCDAVHRHGSGGDIKCCCKHNLPSAAEWCQEVQLEASKERKGKLPSMNRWCRNHILCFVGGQVCFGLHTVRKKKS